MFFFAIPIFHQPRLEAIVRCGYWECKQHVLLTVDAAAAPRILLTGLLDQSPHNAFTAWAGSPCGGLGILFCQQTDRQTHG